MVIPVFVLYFIAAVVSVMCWKKVDAGFRLVGAMLIITLCTEILAQCIRLTFGHNLWIYHIYCFLLVLLFYGIFSNLLEDPKYQKWLRPMYGALALFCIVNSLFLQSFQALPTYTIILTGLCVVFSSLLVLKNMLDEPSRLPLARQGKFWFAAAVFIYQSCSFFHWSVYNFTQPEAARILNIFNIIMCCLYYPALTCSLWLNSQENKSHAGQS